LTPFSLKHGLMRPGYGTKLPTTMDPPELELKVAHDQQTSLDMDLNCAQIRLLPPLYGVPLDYESGILITGRGYCDDLGSQLTLSSISLCPLFVLQPLRLSNPSPQGWAPPGSEPDNPWSSHGMTSPLITQLLASSLPTHLPYCDVTRNVIPLVIPLVTVLLTL